MGTFDDGSEPAGQARGPDGRFLPGNSGNPGGRKPGSGGAPPIARTLRRRVKVKEGKGERRVNVVDAIVRQLQDRALQGDTAAAREVVRMAREQEAAAARAARAIKAEEDEPAAGPWDGWDFRMPTGSLQKATGWFLEALHVLGATDEVEGREVRIRQWVVQAARAREPALAALLDKEPWYVDGCVSRIPDEGREEDPSERIAG